MLRPCLSLFFRSKTNAPNASFFLHAGLLVLRKREGCSLMCRLSENFLRMLDEPTASFRQTCLKFMFTVPMKVEER
jgi:hypothetical protein